MLLNFGEIPRPNWIEIDLDNLQSNIAFTRSLLPKKTKILLPVKADAYGHGSLAISLAAIEAGVDFLGVAHLFEGVALRENGIKARILILGPCLESDLPILIKHNLTPSIQDFETANCLSQKCKDFQNNSKFKIHIQIDTGMHRFGIDCENAIEVKKICELPNLEAEGIYSHLATADMQGHPAMDVQLSRFGKLIAFLEKEGMRPPICHIANSPATFLFSKTHYDMVRPGIALYGYDPVGKFPSDFPIKPVLRLRSTVRAIREVAEGEGISYGHFFVANKNMRVATIAIGYGDGYLRGEPSTGMIFVRGRPCPILGRVCMDACMIDASGVADMQIGDIAECINGEFSEHISVEAFAREHSTISYEITTRMAQRLYRLYKYKGETTGWNQLMNTAFRLQP
ncbi:MAG: alanine racemase [Fibromonadaceae bacterium]|jgi:alanine racemase|nr:alanine racemase [Fibromonadaceae bacterium]